LTCLSAGAAWLGARGAWGQAISCVGIIKSAAAIAIGRHRTARRIGNVVIRGGAATEIVETGFKLLVAIENMTGDWLRIERVRLVTGANGGCDDPTH